MVNLSENRFPAHQRGVVTTIFAVVMLFITSLAAIYIGRSLLLEQKISNNDERSKYAFEAAEAGMSVAKRYLANGPDRDVDGFLDPVFDTDADGIGDVNASTVGAHSVTVTLTDISAGEMSSILITAQGLSDDSTATRTITETTNLLSPLPNAPDNPLTTKGTVIVSGSATVHNPEGHSTIWSGSDVELGSNNATATEVADMTDPSYPGCMDVPMTCNVVPSSNKVNIGLDVIEYDSSLANLTSAEMFFNFFGMNPTTYRDAYVTLETTGATANTDAQLATGEVIWVEGDVSFENATTIGCLDMVTGNNTCDAARTDPSILIINGDASFNGTPHFYGVVYVMGALSITGNTTLYGAMVSAGDLESNAGGSLDIWYNSDLLERLRLAGTYASAPGSWKDF